MPLRLRGLSLVLLLFSAPAIPAHAAPQLSAHGGALGATLDLTIEAPPGQLTLLLFSPTFAPTPLPPPHVSPIDVGLEFLAVSVQSLLAPIPPGGVLVWPLPVPALPALDGVVVNFQALEVQGGILVSKSNPWRVTLDTSGQFATTLSPMATARAVPSATLLGDGSVLVAGGGGGSIGASTGLSVVERYLPNLEAFEPAPSLPHARAGHAALRLKDGRVLFVGGVDQNGAPVPFVDVYDPATGTYQTLGQIPTRLGWSVSLLPDDRVLLAGGSTDPTDVTTLATSAQKTTFLFDPATGQTTPGPNMAAPHSFHSAASLPDGRVVVTGGLTFFTIFGVPFPNLSAKVELYVPSSGAGQFVSLPDLQNARAAHSSVALADGRVLVAGGVSGSIVAPAPTASCELVHPAGSVSAAPSLSQARALPALVLLEDGSVLAAGGAVGSLTAPTSSAAAERYFPTPGGAGSWQQVSPLVVARAGSTPLLLPDGTAALFGGAGGAQNAALSTVEVFQP